jgi:hypothetical protein
MNGLEKPNKTHSLVCNIISRLSDVLFLLMNVWCLFCDFAQVELAESEMVAGIAAFSINNTAQAILHFSKVGWFVLLAN